MSRDRSDDRLEAAKPLIITKKRCFVASRSSSLRGVRRRDVEDTERAATAATTGSKPRRPLIIKKKGCFVTSALRVFVVYVAVTTGSKTRRPLIKKKRCFATSAIR